MNKPTNYIKRLETENAELEAKARAAQDLVTEFLAHLASSKFQGEGDQWIATGDVRSRLLDLRSELL